MKTLMTLSSGFEIQESETNKFIHVSNYEVMAFGDVPEEKATIQVLYKRNPKDGCFGTLIANRPSTCEWRLIISETEAMQLHALLPNVAFEDERVSSAESLADNGGAA